MTKRVYDLGIQEDIKALARQRNAMLSRAYRIAEVAFNDLTLCHRIGKLQIARVLGIGQIRMPSTYQFLRHDLALGLVRLRDAVSAGEVGTLVLRIDGVVSRMKLDDVADGMFATSIDWRAVMEFVSGEGWAYQAFARLVGCGTGQISRLSRGATLPKMALGESVLWAARHVRDGTVVTPPPNSSRFRYPESRHLDDDDAIRKPFVWIPEPLK